MAHVKLIAHTCDVFNNNIESVIAYAAKLCYSKSDIDDLIENQDDKKIEKFINNLLELGHESPLEHVSFTFGIEGISRACSHQLVRHRIASYSQQSQRYVDLNETYKYITPPNIKNDEKINNFYEDINNMIFEKYKELTKMLEDKYISEGLDKKSSNKKAIEDARFILPNACETKIIVTMNVRSLHNFFKERCCNRAQWEIRDVANQMLDICLKEAPLLFKKAGPSCTFGRCKEGKMSCGKRVNPRIEQLKMIGEK